MSNTDRFRVARLSRGHGHRGNPELRAAMLLLALSGSTQPALADNPPAPDLGLTFAGITLYGVVDAGVQYLTHGTPINDYHPAGTEEIIQKNSNGSVTTIGGNNLGQSKLCLRGLEAIGNGWSAIFRVESFFNPWSGELSDAEKSMTNANGVPLNKQQTAVDSSVAGQLFQGAAYVGLSHKTYGTLIAGRQNSLVFDGILKYDPMLASQAFSPIGFSGTASGGGATEDRRLDGAVRYEVSTASIHFAAQYQPTSGVNQGTTTVFALGWIFPGGSIDAYYMQKYDAIVSAPLTAAQVLGVGQVCAGNASAATAAQYACASLDKALNGTISDNTNYSLMGKWSFADNRAILSAGYEHIRYQNPSNPLSNGQIDIGGYVEAHVVNNAFPSPKVMRVGWIGLKYAVTPKLELTGAYYRYDQNAHSTASPGCSSAAVSGQCSGSENFVTFLADYRFNQRFDIYAGAMWSAVQGGLANGFLNTSTIDPTIGVRYAF